MTPRIEGRVSAAYRAPWSWEFQMAVNALVRAAGVTARGKDGGLLSAAEMVEMGEAMTAGVTAAEFAERIIDRAFAEEDRIRRAEWLYENAEGAA